MCGITGIISQHHDGTEIRSFLLRALHRMRHRGPDDQGLWLTDGDSYRIGGAHPQANHPLPWVPDRAITECRLPSAHLGLGHARLSIYDLSPAGHQPMCSHDGNLWVVFNGAIYNFKSLREELTTAGYRFHTATDTEVLLAGWQHWGEALLNRLDGMFAFVFYDKQQQLLVGARDRSGVKPFYYSHRNGTFAFASEQKALVGNGPIPFAWRDAAMAEWYLLRQLDNRPYGFFEHIQALLPGHMFTCHVPTMKLSVKRWHHPEIAGWTSSGLNLPEQIEAIRHRLTDAIHWRAQADVPIATCLSGGLDSSVITALLQQEFKQPITACTAVFPGFHKDESAWAAQLTAHVGAYWNRHEPTREGFIHDLEDLIYTQESPLQSISTYAQYSLMRHISSLGVKVVLDGQGGDELFAGYPIHQVTAAWEAMKRGKMGLASATLQPYGWSFFVRQWAKSYGLQLLPEGLRRPLLQKIHPSLAYLSHDVLRECRTRMSELPAGDWGLNQLLANQYYNGYLSYLLKFEDRNSMRFGIESRVPMADAPALSDLLMQTPGTWKMRGGMPKYLLREAARPWLPEAIVNRTDKVGFVTPNNDWLLATQDIWWPLLTAGSRWIDGKSIQANQQNLWKELRGAENYRIFPLITAAVLEHTFARRLSTEDANAQL